MPRPQKERIVAQPPIFSSFKPTGIRRSSLEQVTMTLDEYEAVRLADYLQMEHEEAAEEMEISRSTFTRLLEKARKKVSSFLIEGRELCFEGGRIHFRGNIIRCLSCNHIFNTGFEIKVDSCPVCGSENLIDLAGGFGHGRCCQAFERNNRRG